MIRQHISRSLNGSKPDKRRTWIYILLTGLISSGMPQPNAAVDSLGCWQTSENVCAFANSERHLGHILKVESVWVAFDGTRLGENGMGFRVIGTFPDVDSAKIAVEFASLRMNAARAS